MDIIKAIAAACHHDFTRFLANLTIQPGGILATRRHTDGSVTLVGTPPSPTPVFVDPAGIDFITQHGPAGAGGAAKDIYNWLKIHNDAEFHPDIKASITRPGQVKYHCYNNCCRA